MLGHFWLRQALPSKAFKTLVRGTLQLRGTFQALPLNAFHPLPYFSTTPSVSNVVHQPSKRELAQLGRIIMSLLGIEKGISERVKTKGG